ncbi:MAG: acyl-CoA dehydrogenase family protein, partial [Actinomycetota bacterium]|nr:acyl-CoA dehydrogenase family protein [Actinomycetota bacterium]
MDLAFTEEQDMLRDAVRGLCADAADSVRALEDDPKGYDEVFWQGLAAMGLTGLMTPEVLGGSGMGLLDAVVVYEELGRSLVPSPHLASSVVAGGVLATAGSDAQRADWLPAMAAGEAVLSVAWLEPDNSSGPSGV